MPPQAYPQHPSSSGTYAGPPQQAGPSPEEYVASALRFEQDARRWEPGNSARITSWSTAAQRWDSAAAAYERQGRASEAADARQRVYAAMQESAR